MWLIHMSRDSFIIDTSHSHVTWPIHMWQVPFTCDFWIRERISKRILCFSCDSPIFNVCSSALLSHRSAEEHTLELENHRKNKEFFLKFWSAEEHTLHSFHTVQTASASVCVSFSCLRLFASMRRNLRLFASYSLRIDADCVYETQIDADNTIVCVYLRLCDAICVYLTQKIQKKHRNNLQIDADRRRQSYHLRLCVDLFCVLSIDADNVLS